MPATQIDKNRRTNMFMIKFLLLFLLLNTDLTAFLFWRKFLIQHILCI